MHKSDRTILIASDDNFNFTAQFWANYLILLLVQAKNINA